MFLHKTWGPRDCFFFYHINEHPLQYLQSKSTMWDARVQYSVWLSATAKTTWTEYIRILNYMSCSQVVMKLSLELNLIPTSKQYQAPFPTFRTNFHENWFRLWWMTSFVMKSASLTYSFYFYTCRCPLNTYLSIKNHSRITNFMVSRLPDVKDSKQWHKMSPVDWCLCLKRTSSKANINSCNSFKF